MTTKSSLEAYWGRAAFICSALEADRVDPRTEKPRARRLSTTWAPMKPVEPVTTMCLVLLVYGQIAYFKDLTKVSMPSFWLFLGLKGEMENRIPRGVSLG